MFIKTSNGYLLNLKKVEMIYISAPDEDYKFFSVKAKLENGNEISLYRDIEQQYCDQYLEDLGKKIAIKPEDFLK